MRAGGVFYLPDTMPIPSRDQLRGMLDDALHRKEQPAHLNEWLQMVRAGNSARNQLDPFARAFEVQHYCRVIHQRHPAALINNTGRFEEALARFLNVSSQLGSENAWGRIGSTAHGRSDVITLKSRQHLHETLITAIWQSCGLQ